MACINACNGYHWIPISGVLTPKFLGLHGAFPPSLLSPLLPLLWSGVVTLWEAKLLLHCFVAVAPLWISLIMIHTGSLRTWMSPHFQVCKWACPLFCHCSPNLLRTSPTHMQRRENTSLVCVTCCYCLRIVKESYIVAYRVGDAADAMKFKYNKLGSGCWGSAKDWLGIGG